MASLSGQTIANTFDSILHVEDDTAGLVATSTDSRVIQDGVGANSALALATDSVRVTSTNKLYINDVGDEYISGDGTDLTIAAGNDLNLTATTDINIPVNVGLRFGDGGENIETDNTDFTITSGAKLNLAPTSDVHTANGTGVVMGHTAQVAMGEVTAEAQILGTTETDATLAIGLFSTTDALSPSLKFVKGGHGTIGSNTTVADNEELGKVQAYGSDGSDHDTLSSEIAFNIDDDGVGAGTLGGEILLKTSGKDGTLDTAVTIDSSQAVAMAGSASVAGDFKLAVTKKLYLDGGGDTYFEETSTNKVRLFIGGTQRLQYQGPKIECNTNFLPEGNKAYDCGEAGQAWDDVAGDDFVNEADFYHFDEYDDLAVINGIKGSGEKQAHNGYELIDDSTLPDWLVAKHKKPVEVREAVLYTDEDVENGTIPEGKSVGDIKYVEREAKEVGDKMISNDGNPYLSLKTMISLLMGAVRQLDAKVEALENE